MSRSTTPSSFSGVTSGYTKVPPILGTIDRAFLIELNDYIDHEMDKINSEEAEQRYIIFKTVFNRVGFNIYIIICFIRLEKIMYKHVKTFFFNFEKLFYMYCFNEKNQATCMDITMI